DAVGLKSIGVAFSPVVQDAHLALRAGRKCRWKNFGFDIRRSFHLKKRYRPLSAIVQRKFSNGELVLAVDFTHVEGSGLQLPASHGRTKLGHRSKLTAHADLPFDLEDNRSSIGVRGNR